MDHTITLALEQFCEAAKVGAYAAHYPINARDLDESKLEAAVIDATAKLGRPITATRDGNHLLLTAGAPPK